MTSSVRRVYVAHPLRGDVAANTRRVTELCRRYMRDPEILPLSPIHAFGFCDPQGPQEVPFRLCRQLLSVCDELWLHGDWRSSEGCRMEREHALALGIPVLEVEVVSDAM